MAIATFKDLCIDATDPRLLGRFWAGALGLEYHAPREDGVVRLTGTTPQHTIWVNAVPEPRTVKQRVHLDVNVHDVADLERLGATVTDAESFRWTVMADPEGGELCAFVRQGEIEHRLYEVVVDCSGDPGAALRIAEWWQRTIGGTVGETDEGEAYLSAVPGMPFEYVVFGPVPEPKTVKNRIHLDVTGRVEDLVAAGATVLRERGEEVGWTVLADPDGNEFCAFAP
jgi:hypothetical protein